MSVLLSTVRIIYYQIWSLICHIDSYSRGASTAVPFSASALVPNYATSFQGWQTDIGEWDKVERERGRESKNSIEHH